MYRALFKQLEDYIKSPYGNISYDTLMTIENLILLETRYITGDSSHRNLKSADRLEIPNKWFLIAPPKTFYLKDKDKFNVFIYLAEKYGCNGLVHRIKLKNPNKVKPITEPKVKREKFVLDELDMVLHDTHKPESLFDSENLKRIYGENKLLDSFGSVKYILTNDQPWEQILRTILLELDY